LIHQISEDLLDTFSNIHLIDPYDAYQHLMNFWMESMQDDCYLITADGWKAEPYRIIEKNKKGNEVDKGWTCDLVPAGLVVNRYFAKELAAIAELESERDALAAKLEELQQEHSGEDGYFAELDKVNKANVQRRLNEIKKNKSAREEIDVLENHLKLTHAQTSLYGKIKEAEEELDELTLARYPKLTADEIKQLVVDDKWMTNVEKSIKGEMDRISQRLTGRIKELAERYETPLPAQRKEAEELEKKVSLHLTKMGFVWN
jgi:type I restriction enzyme M protein